MEIQSTVNISNFIEVDATSPFGDSYKEQIGFLSASVDKSGSQCGINIQLFDDEKIKENKEEVEKQVLEFFNYLSACMKGSKLETIGKLLPEDKDVEGKIKNMNL